MEPGRSQNFWFYNSFLPLKNRTCLFIKPLSPHIRGTKTVLDSGFHAGDSGFQVLDSSPCKWNLVSGFQSELAGFRNPWAAYTGFQSPGLCVTQAKISQIPESGFLALHGATTQPNLLSASKRPNNSTSTQLLGKSGILHYFLSLSLIPFFFLSKIHTLKKTNCCRS